MNTNSVLYIRKLEIILEPTKSSVVMSSITISSLSFDKTCFMYRILVHQCETDEVPITSDSNTVPEKGGCVRFEL